MLGGERAEHGERVSRGVVVVGGERVPQPADRAAERRCLLQCAGRAAVHVDRRGPVHPGDLHEAPERNRADAVLDPPARRLPDRGREPDVEPPRAHAQDERHREVAELVDEDEEVVIYQSCLSFFHDGSYCRTF